jgi:hypothetical protein
MSSWFDIAVYTRLFVYKMASTDAALCHDGSQKPSILQQDAPSVTSTQVPAVNFTYRSLLLLTGIALPQHPSSLPMDGLESPAGVWKTSLT